MKKGKKGGPGGVEGAPSEPRPDSKSIQRPQAEGAPPADPGAGDGVGWPAGDVPPGEGHPPGVRPEPAGDQVEQRGLPGPVGADDGVAVPGVDDQEVLQPRRLYARQGRTGEYDAMVDRMKRERREYLASFPGLDEAIVKSIG